MSRNLATYAEHYANQPYEKYQAAFRKREIVKILSSYPHKTILEVGCGLDSMFRHIGSFERMVVIEPAALFYRQAQQDADGREDVTVINATLEDGYDDITGIDYDFILVSALLHEIPNPKAFLQKIHGLCSRRTIVHINVPNADSFHRLLGIEIGAIHDPHEMTASNIEFQQSTVYDTNTLRQIVEEAGFQIDGSGAYSFKPFTHSQMQRMIDSKLLTDDILEGFYAIGQRMPEFCSEIYVNVRKRNA